MGGGNGLGRSFLVFEIYLVVYEYHIDTLLLFENYIKLYEYHIDTLLLSEIYIKLYVRSSPGGRLITKSSNRPLSYAFLF